MASKSADREYGENENHERSRIPSESYIERTAECRGGTRKGSSFSAEVPRISRNGWLFHFGSQQSIGNVKQVIVVYTNIGVTTSAIFFERHLLGLKRCFYAATTLRCFQHHVIGNGDETSLVTSVRRRPVSCLGRALPVASSKRLLADVDGTLRMS
ncbi:hypothetical protein MTO96_010567 [Rhipicephalus appendiculatus]